jgi:plasmid maintenance system antidote protein VapI
MASALELEQFRRFYHIWHQSCRFTLTTAVALKKCFQDKIGQQMNLQRALDLLRLVLERKALGEFYENYICIVLF